MADEALIVGLEKLQVEGTQHSEKLKVTEDKITLPKKLKCDSSESSDDSGSDSKSDSKSESGSANEKEVKGVSRGERKKKKKVLNKKIKKNGTMKNERDGSTDDKLQCDSSDSKSGSADGSSDSGDESKSQSVSAKERLEGVKQMEKKKGLIEKIREKLSGKPKEETAEVANTDISDMKEGNLKKLDKLLRYSGSESSSANKKDTRVVEEGSKTEKNKVLKRKMKKATKKNEGEANMADKLQCDNSDSKSGSGDDSGSDSKSDSKSDSGSSSEKEKSKEKKANKENKKELEMQMKGQSIKKWAEDQVNRTPGTDHEVLVDANMDSGIVLVNSETIKAMEEDQDVGKKVTKNEVDEQGAAENKGIFGKIMEWLPSYYKKGGK